jgi:hypothetical protein
MQYRDSNVQLMFRYIQFIGPANMYALLKYMPTNVHTQVCQHPITCSTISLHCSAPLYLRFCPAGEPPPRCGPYMLLRSEEYPQTIRDKEKETK